MTLILSFSHFEPESYSFDNHILAYTLSECLYALTLFWPDFLERTEDVQVIKEDLKFKFVKDKGYKVPESKKQNTKMTSKKEEKVQNSPQVQASKLSTKEEEHSKQTGETSKDYEKEKSSTSKTSK